MARLLQTRLLEVAHMVRQEATMHPIHLVEQEVTVPQQVLPQLLGLWIVSFGPLSYCRPADWLMLRMNF